MEGVDFDGAVVLVTGGTRGIGRAVVTAFLDHGARVVACGRHRPVGDPLFADAPDASAAPAGGQAHFVVADVREPEAARAAVEEAADAYGRLDVLVNNAGGSPAAPSAEVSPRFVSAVVSLNLLAPFYCAQAANEQMQRQPEGGCILNIGSVSGLRPSPGSAAYGAAKAGLVNLTATLAVEWAPRVRVNCISAGLLDTGGGVEHYGGAEGLARVAATVPLGRLGTPGDVAGLCLLMASPLAAYVSGANLVAHGGGEWPAFLAAAGGGE